MNTNGYTLLVLNDTEGNPSSWLDINHVNSIVIENSEQEATFFIHFDSHVHNFKNIKDFYKDLNTIAKEFGESSYAGIFLETEVKIKEEDGFERKKILIPKKDIIFVQKNENIEGSLIVLNGNIKIESYESIESLFNKM